MRAPRPCLLLCALLLPAAAQARNLEDIGRETQVYAAYATTDALRPLGLSVSVEGERLTLTGVVRSADEKRLAEEVALHSSGAATVDNRIEIDAGHASAMRLPPEPPPASGWRQRLRDAVLTARIKLQLLRENFGDALDVNVDTVDGKARLRGVADSAQGRARMVDIAAATPGVIKVEDRIALRPPPGTVPTVDAPRASLVDAWITARLKSSLLLSREVDGYAIAVATSRGAVRLSGRVDTPAERAAAVQIARGTAGVRAVDASGLSAG
ncbi:BON domain-containing protein [Solimonas sp. K1W22B-7]|uniref:BON domain-containing protein n=1 Tax=Solimonas sp. K1W22B-7 TaxID=2303331 RepID=UPI0013C48B22|nr:BON domain-containing protein [Solimonas sp. K1W22B-7]